MARNTFETTPKSRARMLVKRCYKAIKKWGADESLEQLLAYPLNDLEDNFSISFLARIAGALGENRNPDDLYVAVAGALEASFSSAVIEAYGNCPRAYARAFYWGYEHAEVGCVVEDLLLNAHTQFHFMDEEGITVSELNEALAAYVDPN